MSDLLPPQSKVLTFDIKSYLVQEHARNMPTGPLTFSGWLSWVPPDYQNPEFLSYATSPDSATVLNYNEKIDGSGDSARFWITDATNVTVWIGGGSVSGSRKIDVSNGDWHHIAATVDRAGRNKYRVELFHNGQSKGAGEIWEEMAIAKGGPLILGQRQWGDSNDQFIGQFASFAFFNRVRSRAEIAAEFNNGLDGFESELARPEETAEPVGGDDFGFDF